MHKLSYLDGIKINYQISNGSFNVMNFHNHKSIVFERGSLLSFFRNKVQDLENVPRIKEFLTKTETPPERLSPIYLGDANVEIGRKDYNRLTYNYTSETVRGYTLSNAITWDEFPEIVQAYQIVKEHYLVGDLDDCHTGLEEEDEHTYTNTQFHDSPVGPWYIHLTLICGSEKRSAFLQLNYDGSYERFEVEK